MLCARMVWFAPPGVLVRYCKGSYYYRAKNIVETDLFFDYTTALWEKLQYAVPRFIGRADDSGQLWVSLLDSRNFDARLIALTARLEQLMKKK